MNIDIWMCLGSGVALAVSSIYIASALPPAGPFNLEDVGNEDLSSEQKQDILNKTDEMCDKLIDKLPKDLNISKDEMRNVMHEAVKSNADDDFSLPKLLNWFLFIFVILLTYYALNLATNQGLEMILKSFFPKEFAFFGIK